jgi:hypothetical protein
MAADGTGAMGCPVPAAIDDMNAAPNNEGKRKRLLPYVLAEEASVRIGRVSRWRTHPSSLSATADRH